MAVNIQTRNLEIPPTIENYIEKKMTKFERILRRGYDIANIEIWNEKHRYIVELSIKFGHKTYRSKDETMDLRACIDIVFDKVKKQIRRQKDKFTSKRTIIEPRGLEEPKGFEEPDVIIENIQYKPMTLEEARLQFESSGGDFFVYIDAHTNKVNVIFKRSDGILGLIKPL
jgi:ribosomal subunit interface protein